MSFHLARVVMGALQPPHPARTEIDVLQATGLAELELEAAVGWLVDAGFVACALEPLLPTPAGDAWWSAPDARRWEVAALELLREHEGESGAWYGRQLGWSEGEYRGRWSRMRQWGWLQKSGRGSASTWALSATGREALALHANQHRHERLVPQGPHEQFSARDATASERQEAAVRWLSLRDEDWTTAEVALDWMRSVGWSGDGAAAELASGVRVGRLELRRCGSARWYRVAGRGDLVETLAETRDELLGLRDEITALRSRLDDHQTALLS